MTNNKWKPVEYLSDELARPEGHNIAVHGNVSEADGRFNVRHKEYAGHLNPLC